MTISMWSSAPLQTVCSSSFKTLASIFVLSSLQLPLESRTCVSCFISWPNSKALQTLTNTTCHVLSCLQYRFCLRKSLARRTFVHGQHLKAETNRYHLLHFLSNVSIASPEKSALLNHNCYSGSHEPLPLRSFHRPSDAGLWKIPIVAFGLVSKKEQRESVNLRCALTFQDPKPVVRHFPDILQNWWIAE